jgi:hypothetical protein
VRIDPKRTYLFQDAIRCAAAQFGVETNHPEFVGLGDQGDFDEAGCDWMWPTVANHSHTFADALKRANGFELDLCQKLTWRTVIQQCGNTGSED